MRILHIEHGVFFGLLHHLIEIEIQRRVIFAGEHDETGCISADLIHQIAQSYKCPRALGHFVRLTILEKLHQLRQLDIERGLVV